MELHGISPWNWIQNYFEKGQQVVRNSAAAGIFYKAAKRKTIVMNYAMKRGSKLNFLHFQDCLSKFEYELDAYSVTSQNLIQLFFPHVFHHRMTYDEIKSDSLMFYSDV